MKTFVIQSKHSNGITFFVDAEDVATALERWWRAQAFSEPDKQPVVVVYEATSLGEYRVKAQTKVVATPMAMPAERGGAA